MTMPPSDSKAAVKRTAMPALRTAVLVAAGPLLRDEPNNPAPHMAGQPIGPLTRVGGLSLFTRAVLTLQRAGITRIMVLADRHEEALRRSLADDDRITTPVHWIPIREFPPEDARTWESLAGELEGSCLIAGVQAIFSRALLEQLRCEVEHGHAVIAVKQATKTAAGEPGLADMVVLPASLLGVAAAGLPSSRGGPIRALVTQASAKGTLRTVQASSDRSAWHRPVIHASDVKAAERVLFQSLRSDLDGYVDTYFNRKLSRALTRGFLALRWSPNAITILSILIGMAAALSFSRGSYLTGVIGGLLFQLSAIIDCCDGEVARLTFKESRVGRQLDLLGDNAVHLAIFAGIAWAGYTGTPSFVPLGLGVAAMAGTLLSLWVVTRFQAGKVGDARRDTLQAHRSEFILKHVTNRDFSVVVLVFALIDRLGVFLWLAAIGSNIFWVYAAWPHHSFRKR